MTEGPSLRVRRSILAAVALPLFLLPPFLVSVPACLKTEAQRKERALARTKKRSQPKAEHVSSAEEQGPKPRARFATAPPPAFAPLALPDGNPYLQRFAALWNDIHDPKNGYFSPEGVPYHSVESLIVEAPDHGHETTSEAYSYWIWLEAAYGKLTGDWRPLVYAWQNLETYIIPAPEDQPTAGSYNYTHPGVFAPELDLPSQYPAPLQSEATPGWDPLFKELMAAYGDAYIYGMHWILDVDNFYGYGRRGDGISRPSYVNTFQRGMEESVWETIPQPSWDDFRFGGENGFVDLFVKQNGGYARQWKYTNAPDADARAIQAMFWAKTWADERGGSKEVDLLVKKAAKMGDYLRYALFDKYFKVLGCRSPTCAPARARESAHYLISWYYAWGGSIAKEGGWAWRIGSSVSHQGYQNPLAAHVLAEVEAFRPASTNGQADWKTSRARQLELLRWLQSAEGAIAGGVSNSWRGRYAEPPNGTKTFYGMAYDEKPVWVDPPSNQWFGFQVWGMERTAALYYLTGDSKAEVILGRFIPWLKRNVRFTKGSGKDGKPGEDFEIPATLEWSGQPALDWDAKIQDWDRENTEYNASLHCKIKDWARDTGIASTTARTLFYYAARAGDNEAAHIGKRLLDVLWTRYRTDKGIASPEVRVDYRRFSDPVYVPAGWRGTMPNGDLIDSNATFIGLRSKYKQDPNWQKVERYLQGGPAPEFTYHRFWAEADIALSNATFAWLFPNGLAAEPKAGGTPGAPGKGAQRKGGPGARPRRAL